jgi:c-di-GMP phosphodiesterase Gmr
MYSGSLTILLCSDNIALKRAVHACPALPGFSHTILEESPECTQLAKLDVLILSSIPTNLQKIKNSCKKSAFLVLCLPPEILANLDEESVSCATELWCATGSEAYLAGCCRKLFALLREKKEAQLTSIYLESTINSIPDLVWYKDCAGKHYKVNDSFCLAVGKEKNQIEGRGHYYIWDIEPEEYAKGEYICLESEETVMKTGKTCLFDECVKSKAGMRQFKTYKTPLRDEDGTIMGTVGIAHDVTNFANIGVELDLLLRNLPFGILIVDAYGHIVRSNEYFQHYFYLKHDDIAGKIYKEWCKNFFLAVHHHTHDNRADVDACIQGNMRVFEMLTSIIYDIFKNPAGTFILFSDVTKARENEKQIQIIANTDVLTNAYNRHYFYEIMNKEGREQLSALVFLDLDNFKGTNDTYGHLEGDKVLQTTATLVRQIFPDDMLVRFGGDEFLLCITHDISMDALSKKITSLLHAVRSTLYTSTISASIGIADARDQSISLDELVRRADAAMYRAKKSGKNRFCLYKTQFSAE